MTREAVGEFEQLILLAILRLGTDAYGVPIIEEIEARTGRTVSQAAAYLTLKRLEQKGWVNSRMADPTPERGGRAKRFFALRSDGLRRLRQTRADLLHMWEGLEPELDRS
jgi:PadR family transcriptional regulator